MVRDINAGRFSTDTSLVLLTHGLSLRVFLMRWFHWTVDEFLNVYNPPNAVPLVRPTLHVIFCLDTRHHCINALCKQSCSNDHAVIVMV